MSLSKTDVFDQLPCGIFSFEEDGTLRFINDLLLEKLEYKNDEILGKPVEKIFTLATRIFYQTHFFPLLKLQGKVEEIFISLACKNGGTIPVLLNASYVTQTVPVLTHCICIPVHQRRKYEDEILQAKKTAEEALNKNEELQKVKDELQTEHETLDKHITRLKQKNTELLELNDVVAHDLQEPVRKINMFTDVILNYAQSEVDEKTANALRVVQKSSLRIQLLLRRLQEYMLVSTDENERTEVDLNEVVKKQIQIIQHEKSGTAATINMQNLPVVQGNELQLQSLFHQVLLNAFQFKSPERDLVIKIDCSIIHENQYNSIEGKYKFIEFARIAVTDNGIGFDPKYASHIFKILKKLEASTDGLGFGLAFCSRIAENHGGSIKATAEEDKGATFTISLPVQ